MIKPTIFLTLIFLSALIVNGQSTSVSPKDLRILEGKQWIGSLTYLDYSANKKVTISSNLTVSRSKTDRVWDFAFEYPKEPNANSKDKIKLSSDGKMFDGETVIERSKLKDKILKIVTTKTGKDDDRPCTIRHTYLISQNSFSIKKEVKIDGEKDFFERNTYSWTR